MKQKFNGSFLKVDQSRKTNGDIQSCFGQYLHSIWALADTALGAALPDLCDLFQTSTTTRAEGSACCESV